MLSGDNVVRLARVLLSCVGISALCLCLGCHRGQVTPSPAGGGFYDSERVAEYAACIDALVSGAHSEVYSSPAEIPRDPDHGPHCWTSNGILILYSITHIGDSYLHHVSMSRPPYLATPYGSFLMALFAARAGFPTPKQVRMSQNAVYHCTWTLSADEHAALKERLASAPAVPPNDFSVLLNAFLGSGKIEVVRVQVGQP